LESSLIASKGFQYTDKIIWKPLHLTALPSFDCNSLTCTVTHTYPFSLSSKCGSFGSTSSHWLFLMPPQCLVVKITLSRSGLMALSSFYDPLSPYRGTSKEQLSRNSMSPSHYQLTKQSQKRSTRKKKLATLWTVWTQGGRQLRLRPCCEIKLNLTMLWKLPKRLGLKGIIFYGNGNFTEYHD
jgi:hypothetical protein